MQKNSWVTTKPNLKPRGKGIRAFLRSVKIFLVSKSKDQEEEIRKVKDRLLQDLKHKDLGDEKANVIALFEVISNFIEHGWRVQVSKGKLQIARPDRERSDREECKKQIQRALKVERDKALAETTSASFIREMETRRLTKAGWISVFNLMRDGRDLASKLRNRRDKESIVELKKLISPYLQFVETHGGDKEKVVCQETGLPLANIWRYFRMTWSNKYESVPGRKMMILIRDRAAPFHPIIGIAALSSAIPKLSVRDEWLGWKPEVVWRRVTDERSEEWAQWIHSSWGTLIKELFIDDFIEEKVISIRDVSCPSREVIDKLRKAGKLDRESHHLYARKADFEVANQKGSAHWRKVATASLFRSKRALALSNLLEVRMVLCESGFTKPTKENFSSFLNMRRARWVIETLAKVIKGRTMGINIMDISLCGALKPYSEILGGKLVAMLLTSPEVIEEYRRRYKNYDSIIASSMAGRVIRRDPTLVFLCTTSLYGIASSQYNRVVIPANRMVPEKDGEIRYRKLGTSSGFGTFHIGSESLKAIDVVFARANHGRRVNSIFGEGASPRLRKIREGLDELGLPSNEILKHGDERIVYGINLVKNPGAYLLGLTDAPDYIVNGNGKQISGRIVDWWMKRWLLNRAKREEVLCRVEQHDLTYPIQHGARAPQVETQAEKLISDWG